MSGTLGNFISPMKGTQPFQNMEEAGFDPSIIGLIREKGFVNYKLFKLNIVPRLLLQGLLRLTDRHFKRYQVSDAIMSTEFLDSQDGKFLTELWCNWHNYALKKDGNYFHLECKICEGYISRMNSSHLPSCTSHAKNMWKGRM